MEDGVPQEEFAQLRKTAPVWWNAQLPGKGGGFSDGGYWVVTKHADIRDISKNAEDWSAAENGVIMRFDDDMPPEALEVTKAGLLINHDPPEHTRLRKIVAKAFTPRAVHGLEEKLDGRRARSCRRRLTPATAISCTRSPSTYRSWPSPTCSACRRKTG